MLSNEAAPITFSPTPGALAANSARRLAPVVADRRHDHHALVRQARSAPPTVGYSGHPNGDPRLMLDAARRLPAPLQRLEHHLGVVVPLQPNTRYAT